MRAIDPTRVQGDEPRRIIEAVIAQLAARRDDPLDRLEYLLRNCGYLAERRADRVVLSDNAHPGDFQYLAPWLPFGPDALATFPWVRELSRRATESCGIGRRHDRFLQRAHGYKVAVRCLDGLLAYLVKALSAVGSSRIGPVPATSGSWRSAWTGGVAAPGPRS